jgi:hypothetical protein
MECLMLPISLRFHEFSSVSHTASCACPWERPAGRAPGDWCRWALRGRRGTPSTGFAARAHNRA